ncbi:MAG: DUF2914 domain-containing protein [Deferribacteres bacterium]|nr:DUF2914 domain-containing protein [candidate division KSB1 bacterium]MCB9504103.1 DUF2914 domain-containing protein [Deferribacteres bacterium]
MQTETMILLIGMLMVFIGIFGGGFEIKEIKVPKVNNLSRILGFFAGVFLIIWSQGVLKEILPNLSDSSTPDPLVVVDPENAPDKEGVAKLVEELETAWNDPAFENEFLLAEYKKLDTPEIHEQLSLIEKNTLLNRIQSLQKSIEAFNALQSLEENGTLTISEKRDAWQNAEIDRISTKDAEEINTHTKKYQEMLENWSSLSARDDFLTCRKVDKNSNQPIGATSTFDQKDVWVWAKLNVPQNENLTMQWLDNNGELIKEIKPIKVKKSNGYRTHYWKNFDKPGKYEVRLLNSQDDLIARQEFEVTEYAFK